MFSEKVSRAFSSKVFYIIFSIVAAIALWLYVKYSANPDVEIPVSGIRIEYQGESILNDKNLVITDIDVETLTLRFAGKRSSISKLLANPPTVTVDLSVISGAGQFQLPYSPVYPSGVSSNSVSIAGGSVDYVTVMVEKMVSKSIPVDGIYNGGTQDGYTAEPVEFSPEVITVSGPDAEVAKVSKAWVNIQRENLSKSVEEAMQFILIDADGKEVNSDLLTVSQDTITVSIPVVMQKDVTLTANLIYGAGATEENTTIKIEPTSVTLKGDSETLGELNQIVLGTIDLTKFSSTFAETYSIAIPNGTTNVTGVSEATVTVEVTGLSTKKLSASNIQVSNVTEGYAADIITQSLDITLRGNAAALDDVAEENIRIVADLSDLGETTGSFTVAAKVLVDGFGDVGAVGDYKVSVTLSKAVPQVSANTTPSGQTGGAGVATP